MRDDIEMDNKPVRDSSYFDSVLGIIMFLGIITVVMLIVLFIGITVTVLKTAGM